MESPITRWTAVTAAAGVALGLTFWATRVAVGQSGDLIVIPPDAYEPIADAGVPRDGDDGGDDENDVGVDSGDDGGLKIVRINETLTGTPPTEVDLEPRDDREAILRVIGANAAACIAGTQSPKRSDVGLEYGLTKGNVAPRLTDVTNSEQLHVSLAEIGILRYLGAVSRNVSITQEDRWLRRCLRTVRLPAPVREPAVLSFRVKWSLDGYQLRDVQWAPLPGGD